MDAAQGMTGEVGQNFIEAIPKAVASLRSYSRAADVPSLGPQLMPVLRDMFQMVHAVTGQAAMMRYLPATVLTTALEALLLELFEDVEGLNASALRTVANAAEFLAFLLQHASSIGPESGAPPLVLAVDDEVISLRTLRSALEMARLRAVAVPDPVLALRILEHNSFDMVFMDVEMPGMNGFELCSRLRKMPNHKTTPVVFVTSLSDFDNRARSIVSGGNDLIGKPYLMTELAVKALTYVLKGQIKPPK
jgi:CheY-like chemotaxis protein